MEIGVAVGRQPVNLGDQRGLGWREPEKRLRKKHAVRSIRARARDHRALVFAGAREQRLIVGRSRARARGWIVVEIIVRIGGGGIPTEATRARPLRIDFVWRQIGYISDRLDSAVLFNWAVISGPLRFCASLAPRFCAMKAITHF
jgi:hypothetical protein